MRELSVYDQPMEDVFHGRTETRPGVARHHLPRNRRNTAACADGTTLHAERTHAQFPDELLTPGQQESGRNGGEMRTQPARLPHRERLEKFGFGFNHPSTNGRSTDWPLQPLPPARKILFCWGRPVFSVKNSRRRHIFLSPAVTILKNEEPIAYICQN